MILDKTILGTGTRKRVSTAWRLVVHRLGPKEQIDQGTVQEMVDGDSVTKFFAGHPELTGSPHPPYTFVMREDGAIEQVEPLDIVTPHAMMYNQTGCGLALIGDFRHYEPSPHQWDSLVSFATSWQRTNPLPGCIAGHDELPHAMRNSKKECPGNFLNMTALREAVRIKSADPKIPTLREIGVVFSR